MKKINLQTEFQNTLALAREAVSLWTSDLQAANLMDTVSKEIKLLEELDQPKIKPDDLKARAESLYKAVATSKLPEGCGQRSAVRSIAHCIFAGWFYKNANEEKSLSALRDARCNAEIALRANS